MSRAPLLHLRHSSFSNPSFASRTSQALHLDHLASRPWATRVQVDEQTDPMFPRFRYRLVKVTTKGARSNGNYKDNHPTAIGHLWKPSSIFKDCFEVETINEMKLGEGEQWRLLGGWNWRKYKTPSILTLATTTDPLATLRLELGTPVWTDECSNTLRVGTAN